MAKYKFRKGAEAIRAAVASKAGGYTPTLRWSEDKEVHYVQFLDPLEDVPNVLMHIAMIVGEYDNGKPMRRDFVSPLDPAVDGGSDPIAEAGWQPKQRNVFRVVELEPIYAKGSGGRKKIEDFDFALRTYENKDGEEVSVPNVAFIVESPYIFGDFLATYDDTDPIEDSIWKVTQSGVRKDKKFVFERVPGVEPLDLSDIEEEVEQLGDIDSFLEGLADPERLEGFTADKPEGWVYNEYGGPKKGDKDEESKPARSRGRRKAAEAEAEGDPGDSDDNDPEAEEEEAPKGRSRASRRRTGGRDFSNLRKAKDAS